MEHVTWAAATQAVVSAIGFFLVIYQMRTIRQSLRASTHDRLESHYSDIIKLLMQKPHIRPFFYDGVAFDPENHPLELRHEIDIMSEAILGVIEHAWLQRRTMLDDSWGDCWKPYALERLTKSPELRAFLKANLHWYTDGIRALSLEHRRSESVGI